MRATFRRGPVGTGAYLLGHRPEGEAHDLDVWLLLLFFPVVPLARWRVTTTPPAEGREGESLEVTCHSRSRVPLGAALRRIAAAAVVTVLTCLPFFVGAWTIGRAWATPALNALLGAVVGEGLLGKVGVAIEMGAVLAAAAVPVLVLMHLDARTPRVPLLNALRPEAGGGAPPSGLDRRRM